MSAKKGKMRKSEGGKRSERSKTYTTIIGLNNIEVFHNYVITWFANVATMYLINQRLSRELNNETTLNELCSKAREYVEEQIKRHERLLPLTSNDNNEYFDIYKAVDMVCDPSTRTELISLQPALSLEFFEHVRVLNPQATNKYLKREVVGVEKLIQGLAVIGASISHTYEDGEEDEWGYTYIEAPNPEVIDHRKLSRMIQNVIRVVRLNDGSKISMLVGAASAIALIGRDLLKRSRNYPLNVYFLRLTKGGNRTLVKAFEVLNLNSLAYDIYKLGVASALYNVFLKYSTNVKDFAEDLAKAIFIYNLHRNPEEIYRVLRSLSSRDLREGLSKHYEDKWELILDELLQIRV